MKKVIKDEILKEQFRMLYYIILYIFLDRKNKTDVRNPEPLEIRTKAL